MIIYIINQINVIKWSITFYLPDEFFYKFQIILFTMLCQCLQSLIKYSGADFVKIDL